MVMLYNLTGEPISRFVKNVNVIVPSRILGEPPNGIPVTRKVADIMLVAFKDKLTTNLTEAEGEGGKKSVVAALEGENAQLKQELTAEKSRNKELSGKYNEIRAAAVVAVELAEQNAVKAQLSEAVMRLLPYVKKSSPEAGGPAEKKSPEGSKAKEDK